MLLLGRMNLFPSQPRCVLKGLLNVFLLEVWIVIKDRWKRRPLRCQRSRYGRR